MNLSFTSFEYKIRIYLLLYQMLNLGYHFINKEMLLLIHFLLNMFFFT